MRTRLIGLVLILASMSGGLAHAAASVEDFVSLPKYGAVSLSTDGKHIAAATQVDGDSYMVVMNIEDPKQPDVIWQMKPVNGESVLGIEWVSPDRILFTTSNTLGTLASPRSTGRIYAVNKDGKLGALVMGPTTGRSVFGLGSIVDKMPEDPRHIKVMTRGQGRGQQMEIVDIFNGNRDTVATSPFDNGGLLADDNGNARFAVGLDDSTNTQYYAYRPTADSDWVEFENPFEGNVAPLKISRDGTTALMTTNDEGNFGIVRLNLQTKEVSQVISHDKVPAYSFFLGTDNETIAGVEFLPGLPEVQYMDQDDEHVRLWKRLHASFPGHHVRMGDVTDDGKMALVSISSDLQPPRYFLLDIENFSARYLFDVKPEINADEMNPKESFWITARDGVEFQVYVTRPKDAAEGPLPTVMVIHGGPHGPRDEWQWNDEAQLLSSRGYVVIQPNYRGSGGFGYQFERSGYRKWGLEMQDDVTDATLWAIEQGIADPNKTCIYGGSYGGYSTMSGITKEPDLYACAFAFVGVYDLEMFRVRGDIPDSKFGRTYLDQAIGEDEADLKARSPANHVDKIITPLYIAHGKADKRVPVQQFYNLRDKLDDADIPYEELLVAREGHGFYALKNRVKYYRELLSFLEKHIGPDAPGKATTTASVATQTP